MDRQPAVDAESLRAFLPDDPNLHLTHILFGPAAVTVNVEVVSPSAECPRCGHGSEQVHSWYTRRVTDLPWCGRTLAIVITARKFRCGNPACPRAIFCERLPDIAPAHARTTGPLTESHRAIGFAAGGEAGARLAERLAMPTSPDTLLRRVKAVTGRIKTGQ
jgi:transposase